MKAASVAEEIKYRMVKFSWDGMRRNSLADAKVLVLEVRVPEQHGGRNGAVIHFVPFRYYDGRCVFDQCAASSGRKRKKKKETRELSHDRTGCPDAGSVC